MAKQVNTPKDWRLLAERDMAIADHLAATMRPVPTETIAFFCYDIGLSLSEEDMRIVLNHTKTIKDFLQKEIPELF